MHLFVSKIFGHDRSFWNYCETKEVLTLLVVNHPRRGPPSSVGAVQQACACKSTISDINKDDEDEDEQYVFNVEEDNDGDRSIRLN